jgi:hypothetical protein
MSGYIPLGAGVTDRRPMVREKMAQVQGAELDVLNANMAAADLLDELSANPVLGPIVHELNVKINEFLASDPFCMALVKIIVNYRKVATTVPGLVAAKLNRLLGPQLVQAMEASEKSTETQAAP